MLLACITLAPSWLLWTYCEPLIVGTIVFIITLPLSMALTFPVSVMGSVHLLYKWINNLKL